MIKRELYMKRIRPFMGKDIVKVLTGIRRCGKSVMLELIKEELLEQGIEKSCILSINFETRALDYVKDVESAYRFIQSYAKKIKQKLILLLDDCKCRESIFSLQYHQVFKE